MTLLIAVSFWFLVRQDFGGDVAAKAMGPYPSLEICLTAGHDAFPEDQRFMTPEQIATQRAKREAQARELQRKRDAFMQTHPKGGNVSIDPCTVERLDEHGISQYTAAGCFTPTQPTFHAISSCTRVKP